MESLHVFPEKMPQNCIWHDQVAQDIAIFYDVNLVKGELVVDYENLADFLGGVLRLTSIEGVL